MKKTLSSLLLSATVLSIVATPISVLAEESNSRSVDTSTTDEVLSVDNLSRDISSIEQETERLQSQNEKLNKELDEIATKIEELSKEIVSREESLKAQARDMQTRGITDTNVLSLIVNSSSLTDFLQRKHAADTLVKASHDNFELAKKDKAELEKQQKETNRALETVLKNQEIIAANEANLNVKNAQLKVEQVKLLIANAGESTDKTSLEAQLVEAEAKVNEAKAQQEKEEAELKAKKEELARLSQKPVEEIVVGTVSTANGPVAHERVNATVSEIGQAPVQSTASQATITANYNQANTYPVGQCTWGSKALAPWVGNYWGNARDWIASAQAAGFSVGTQPVVGSVAVWQFDGGGYGHVAVVTAVESTTNIQVSESNYAGNMSIGNYRGWFNPLDGMWGGSVYYIYP